MKRILFTILSLGLISSCFASQQNILNPNNNPQVRMADFGQAQEKTLGRQLQEVLAKVSPFLDYNEAMAFFINPDPNKVLNLNRLIKKQQFFEFILPQLANAIGVSSQELLSYIDTKDFLDAIDIDNKNMDIKKLVKAIKSDECLIKFAQKLGIDIKLIKPKELRMQIEDALEKKKLNIQSIILKTLNSDKIAEIIGELIDVNPDAIKLGFDTAKDEFNPEKFHKKTSLETFKAEINVDPVANKIHQLASHGNSSFNNLVEKSKSWINWTSKAASITCMATAAIDAYYNPFSWFSLLTKVGYVSGSYFLFKTIGDRACSEIDKEKERSSRDLNTQAQICNAIIQKKQTKINTEFRKFEEAERKDSPLMNYAAFMAANIATQKLNPHQAEAVVDPAMQIQLNREIDIFYEIVKAIIGSDTNELRKSKAGALKEQDPFILLNDLEPEDGIKALSKFFYTLLTQEQANLITNNNLKNKTDDLDFDNMVNETKLLYSLNPTQSNILLNLAVYKKTQNERLKNLFEQIKVVEGIPSAILGLSTYYPQLLNHYKEYFAQADWSEIIKICNNK